MQASGASARRRFSPLGGVLKIMAVLAVTVGFGLAAERTDAVDAGHSVAAKPDKEPANRGRGYGCGDHVLNRDEIA